MKRMLLISIGLLLFACKSVPTPILTGDMTATEPPTTPAATVGATGEPTATETGAPINPASITPTPNPNPPASKSVLWSANWETGSLAQLYLPDIVGGQNAGGGSFNIASGQVTITDSVAHSGRYSAQMTIESNFGEPQAVRLFRWRENPEEAFYSAWYLFPQKYKPLEWWNIMQFLSAGDDSQATMWVLNVGNRPGGDMYLYLYDWQMKRTYSQDLTTVPVGRWTHIQVYYRRSESDTGRVTVWQDGLVLFDLIDVRTANSNQIKWSMDNYTDDISPGIATIYVDDAAISTQPIGQ
jgi:hypothetical protein